jgi:hypothetical protein
MFLLRVPCERKKQRHLYDWRGDWPVDATIRSRQEHHCKKHQSPTGGVWLALDPEQMEASRQVHAEGVKAFAAWKAERANRIAPAPKF